MQESCQFSCSLYCPIPWGKTVEVLQNCKSVIVILLKGELTTKRIKVKEAAQQMWFLGVKWQAERCYVRMDQILAESPPIGQQGNRTHHKKYFQRPLHGPSLCGHCSSHGEESVVLGCVGHRGSLHHSKKAGSADTVQWDPLGHCHFQVREPAMTPPETLSIRPSFIEPLPTRAFPASVHVPWKGSVAAADGV